ncbi:MAG: hypothetical protein ACRYFX_09105 [Janthinobacterium lividum]
MSPLPAPLHAFRHEPALKAQCIARVAAHRAAGDLVRGVGVGQATPTGWRGSAIGCSFQTTTAPYVAAPTQLGVPPIVAGLLECFFDQLPDDQYQDWPEQFWQAIPVGADLSGVWPRFVQWLLLDSTHGLRRMAQSPEQGQAVEEAGARYAPHVDAPDASRTDWQAPRFTALAHYATQTVEYAAAAQAALAAVASTSPADEDYDFLNIIGQEATRAAIDVAYRYADAAYVACYADWTDEADEAYEALDYYTGIGEPTDPDARTAQYCLMADTLLGLLAAAPVRPPGTPT